MVLHRFPWTSCGTALSPGDVDVKANDDDVMMLRDFHTQLPRHPDGPPTWAALGPDQHLCAQLVPLERPHCWSSKVFIFLSLFLPQVQVVLCLVQVLLRLVSHLEQGLEDLPRTLPPCLHKYAPRH